MNLERWMDGAVFRIDVAPLCRAPSRVGAGACHVEVPARGERIADRRKTKVVLRAVPQPVFLRVKELAAVDNSRAVQKLVLSVIDLDRQLRAICRLHIPFDWKGLEAGAV